MALGRSVADVELKPKGARHAHITLARRDPDPAHHTHTAIALIVVDDSRLMLRQFFEMDIFQA